MKTIVPIPLDATTSFKLSRVKQRDTPIELAVRAVLYAYGYSYRTKNSDLPGSPDIANRRNKWAIFVHGCFWHHHKGCSKATIPKNNIDFWSNKFERNKKRDAAAIAALKNAGYRVLVIWECETKKANILENKIINFMKIL